jgi:LPXTG-site transpeptidase (sortase) family protein
MHAMEGAFPRVGELSESKVVLAHSSKRQDRMRQWFAFFLAGCGLLLLLYVSCQYWLMYSGQKKLALEWHQENAWPASMLSSDGDALVRLTITKIKLDAVIVEGTSHKSLKLGPGHMRRSALLGSSGNVVVVAHRDTFFRHLDELREGDEVDLRRRGEVYRFEVTGRRVVEPTDLSALRQSSSAQLTLITCYPTHYVGPAPKRLVVVARWIATQKTAGEQILKFPDQTIPIPLLTGRLNRGE